MNLLRRAFGALEKRNVLDNPGVPLASPGAWQYLLDDSRFSDAGEIVNDHTALMNATVFSCVRVIAESISALPLRLLKVTSAGRSVATDEDLYDLLALAPNDEMSAVNFWEAICTSLALRGNSYSQIQRNITGDVVALWPLNPHQVTPLRDMQGNLVYRVNVAQDGEPAEYKVLDKADVLHVRLFGFTGLTGISVIDMQRQAIGLAIGQNRHAARLFKNSSVPALALINKSPLAMSPVDKVKAREDWETLQTGASQHRIAILDADFDIKQLGLTNEQSQFLQSRQLSIEEIAGIFKVPSHLIGVSTRITNSNMEQQNISYLTNCLVPYLTRIEREVQIKLLPKNSRMKKFVVEFDTSSLLRGDSAAQAAWYTAGVNGGWMNPAEVRHQIGLNPAPEEAGLTQWRVPVNYMSSELLIDQQAPETNPMPEPVTDGDDKPVTAQERSALRQYGLSYGRLFVDAVRKTAEGANVSQTFGPLLESIADLTADTAGVEPDTQRMIDHLTKLETRAGKWTADNAETIAPDELRKAVRAFVFGAHEQAAKVVLGE
jgi:HK97 family phage portal protein